MLRQIGVATGQQMRADAEVSRGIARVAEAGETGGRYGCADADGYA
jgi:hypothetical protein